MWELQFDWVQQHWTASPTLNFAVISWIEGPLSVSYSAIEVGTSSLIGYTGIETRTSSLIGYNSFEVRTSSLIGYSSNDVETFSLIGHSITGARSTIWCMSVYACDGGSYSSSPVHIYLHTFRTSGGLKSLSIRKPSSAKMWLVTVALRVGTTVWLITVLWGMNLLSSWQQWHWGWELQSD